MEYSKIIFVAQTGTCRVAMAEGILKEFTINKPLEIVSRGLVVQFPEPINQKAEAVLISNGIMLEDYASVQLSEADLTPGTLVLAMEAEQRDRVVKLFGAKEGVEYAVLTEFVGDELEILNPYGGDLSVYGLCYETLRKSIKKLVNILNGGK